MGTGKPQTLGFFWGKSPRNPEFQGWGRGYNYQNVRGHFGDGETPNFGYGDELQLLKCSGTLWEQGNPKFRGLGGKSPKIPKFRGGDGERNIGDFPHTNSYCQLILPNLGGIGYAAKQPYPHQ